MYDRVFEAAKGLGVVFGTHCAYKDIGMYEVCGRVGYDYVWIDGEHGSLSLNEFQDAIIGTNAGGAAAIVRVPGHEERDVKAILDMGPQGVIFPQVNTASIAEKVIKHCLYPPQGTRGFAPLRAMDYYQMSARDYLSSSMQHFLRIIQCEHYTAVNNLYEILEVPGISAVIVGPLDLSLSIGKLGQYSDPEFIELTDRVIHICKEKKIPFGISTGRYSDFLKYWIDNGASFVSVGNMYDFFISGSRNLLAELHSYKETSS